MASTAAGKVRPCTPERSTSVAAMKGALNQMKCAPAQNFSAFKKANGDPTRCQP